MSVCGTTADKNGLACQCGGRMWSSALLEPMSPRMSLILDASENNCRLLFGEKHAREIFGPRKWATTKFCTIAP